MSAQREKNVPPVRLGRLVCVQYWGLVLLHGARVAHAFVAPGAFEDSESFGASATSCPSLTVTRALPTRGIITGSDDFEPYEPHCALGAPPSPRCEGQGTSSRRGTHHTVLCAAVDC